MNPAGFPSSPAVEALVTTLDEALELLREFSKSSEVAVLRNQTPASLLDQCLSLCAEQGDARPEPVRTVHHFACTGGTLISKCLAAMPNTQLISEIDPLSTLQHNPAVPRFAPTDMIQLMRQSTRGASSQLVVDLFLSNLAIIQANSVRNGQRLVLRDHAHSHFCTGSEVQERATFRNIVASKLPVLSIVTVRDPIDSFISLRSNALRSNGGWIHFEPQTFDEYCRRYMAFLKAYEGVPVVKYEAFTNSPRETMKHICDLLELSFSEQFSELFGVFALTGDSGRKSDVIEGRSRESIDPEFMEEMISSPKCRMLRSSLEYE